MKKEVECPGGDSFFSKPTDTAPSNAGTRQNASTADQSPDSFRAATAAKKARGTITIVEQVEKARVRATTLPKSDDQSLRRSFHRVARDRAAKTGNRMIAVMAAIVITGRLF